MRGYDHLHPNDASAQAMARIIDLRELSQGPGPGASEPPDGWRQPRRPATRSATHTSTRASAGDHPTDARKETFA